MQSHTLKLNERRRLVRKRLIELGARRDNRGLPGAHLQHQESTRTYVRRLKGLTLVLIQVNSIPECVITRGMRLKIKL